MSEHAICKQSCRHMYNTSSRELCRTAMLHVECLENLPPTRRGPTAAHSHPVAIAGICCQPAILAQDESCNFTVPQPAALQRKAQPNRSTVCRNIVQDEALHRCIAYEQMLKTPMRLLAKTAQTALLTRVLCCW